jgi:hypothetical protein
MYTPESRRLTPAGSQAPRLERREFLRLTGLSLLGAALPLPSLQSRLAAPSSQLGRILQEKADVFAEPSFGRSTSRRCGATSHPADGGDRRSAAGDEPGLVPVEGSASFILGRAAGAGELQPAAPFRTWAGWRK